MLYNLTVDGETPKTPDCLEGDPDITLQFYNDGKYRCENCGESMWEEADGFNECECGHGKAVYQPLSWVNWASIKPDEETDSVALYISTGDPRGAFSFQVTKHPDGEFRMWLPYPNQGWAHEDTAYADEGTLIIGKRMSREEKGQFFVQQALRNLSPDQIRALLDEAK